MKWAEDLVFTACAQQAVRNMEPPHATSLLQRLHLVLRYALVGPEGPRCKCRGQLDTLHNGMATSASLLGAVIGSAIAIFLRDKIGRKFELLLSAGCYGEQKSNSMPDLNCKMLLVSAQSPPTLPGRPDCC